MAKSVRSGIVSSKTGTREAPAARGRRLHATDSRIPIPSRTRGSRPNRKPIALCPSHPTANGRISTASVISGCRPANRTDAPAPLTITDAEAIHRRSVRDAVVNSRPNRDGDDGRSQWFKFTLSNGDVIFGCYPQGFNAQLVIDNPSR
jgi:hypothetical protein